MSGNWHILLAGSDHSWHTVLRRASLAECEAVCAENGWYPFHYERRAGYERPVPIGTCLSCGRTQVVLGPEWSETFCFCANCDPDDSDADPGDEIDANEYMEEARVLHTEGVGAWREMIGY